MPAVPNEVTLVAALPMPAATVVVRPPLVDLLFDQPAATDANLVFGANYIAPRDDVTVQATLPLPVIAIKFIPPARAELLAELRGLTVRSLVLRPSVPLNVGAGSSASLPGVVFSGEVKFGFKLNSIPPHKTNQRITHDPILIDSNEQHKQEIFNQIWHRIRTKQKMPS